MPRSVAVLLINPRLPACPPLNYTLISHVLTLRLRSRLISPVSRARAYRDRRDNLFAMPESAEQSRRAEH